MLLLTRIGFIAVGDGNIAVITRVGEDDCSNSTKVLSVLDLEASEKPAILYEGDFALDLNTELNELFEVLDGTETGIF